MISITLIEYEPMSTNNGSIISFLEDLMSRRNKLPCQLATDVGVSHTSVLRWLAGKENPSTRSCRKLADYSGTPIEAILAKSGHLPARKPSKASEWPEFREYALTKYPDELDEDIVSMIEDMIERRRQKKLQKKGKST